MLVNVCVTTFQRQEGLKRLLDSLNSLEFVKCETPEIEVIIIDNHSSQTARETYENTVSNFRWSLKYYVEPQRGISFARNRAIASLNPDAEFMAFIDDDEVAEPSWLDELLSTQQTYDADVVSGPVLPHFMESDVPEWILSGNFFDTRHFPTGHELDVAFAGNVLLRTEIFKKIDKAFDERFALTGGEDSHFFMRLHQMGYKMVWADEARASEWIPKTRTNARWILRRGYRTWSTHSFCEREFKPSVLAILLRMLKGMGLIIYGLLLLLPSLMFKRHVFIKALLFISRGSGTFSGLFGRQVEEYKVTHGT